MNLLEDPWIPVRSAGGTGEFRLLTYRQLLCEPSDWQVSLPRDDLELACLQLLVCMTQIMFLPENIAELRERLATPLTPGEFTAGIAPCLDWFDLDHSTQPFMQSNEVKATKVTPIQKLLIGLPEGNNHAFFNEAGEVQHLSGTLAAIALFNQASNGPNWSGRYKGGLRGGAPITTLVFGNSLREIVWRNVLTRPNLATRQIAMPGLAVDLPTWVKPISERSTIHWNEIGLARGLFWQPVRLRLVKSPQVTSCGVLGGNPVEGYSGFIAEPDFKFNVEGVWPHPHSTLSLTLGKGEMKEKFASFTSTAPAWTNLTEFVVQHGFQDGNQAALPAGPITQAAELDMAHLSLLVGGYRNKQAAVLERRHELMSLAQGWNDEKGRLPELVGIGTDAKKSLYGKLMAAAKDYENKKRRIRLKGIGVTLQEAASKLFYVRTESLIHQAFSNELTWKEWPIARARFAEQIAAHCKAIFEELTNPYTAKPELCPIIAWTRYGLDIELKKLKEDA